MAGLSKEIAGLSLKTLLGIILVLLLFGAYIGIILFGENSLTILNKIEAKEQKLKEEIAKYEHENKRLQKEYFELQQLLPKEEK